MKPSQQEITETVCKIVKRITEDWNLDAAIVPETRLIAELGFTSIDVIDLLASLEIS